MFESAFVGFLARQVAVRPEFLAQAPIDDVCSVSEHISPSAPDRLERCAHNSAGFYDTEALAWSVVPADERYTYTLFAYRAVCIRFGDGNSELWSPADDWPGLPTTPDLSAYAPIGYDIVNTSFGGWFDCSPLSCNSIADEQAVNEHCLVGDVEVAMQLGSAFADEAARVEPGPYHVVEVLQRMRPHRRAGGGRGFHRRS